MKYKIIISVISPALMLASVSCDEEQDHISLESEVKYGIVVRKTQALNENCPNGGVRIDMGIDINGNGSLDDDEIDNTDFICHGANGDPGDKGDKGDPGDKGDKGDNGANGSAWLSGSGSPTVETGADGDLFIDNSTNDIYQKESGNWNKVGNLQGDPGPKGDPGSTIASGVSFDKNGTDLTSTDVQSALEELLNRIKFLETTIAQQQAVIETQNQEIDTQNQKIDTQNQKIDTHNSEIVSHSAQISLLETKTANMQLSQDNNGYDVLVFQGINVQIRSQSGPTDLDGTGNLIVGWNEALPSLDRSGSNNLVIGNNHSYSSHNGFVTGYQNAISSPFASVCGGRNNSAQGESSSVTGGEDNTASGKNSSVTGGADNRATGDNSSVTGGSLNTASGFCATVSGGGSLFPFSPGYDATGNLDWRAGGLYQDY